MNRPLIFLSLFASASAVAPSAMAAVTLVNGNFENTTSTFPTGWTTTGTIASVASIVPSGTSSAELQTTEGIHQDFSATAGDALMDFQLDFAFRTSAAPADGATQHRIRVRGDNNVGDIITISLDANSIRTFSGAFADDLGGISIAANTTYYFRLTGTDFDLATRSFTLGFSTDGVSYTTSGTPSTRFHSAPAGTGFQTIRLEGNGATMTVDNVSVIDLNAVPEPSTALLGGLSLLGLLRRRR